MNSRAYYTNGDQIDICLTRCIKDPKTFRKPQDKVIKGWIFIAFVGKYSNSTRWRSTFVISEFHFNT